MGDSRRFDLFASLATRHFHKDACLVDVAGGRGYLRLALQDYGFTNITTWDIRKSHISDRSKYIHRLFDYRTAPAYEGIVAMHPDEVTDHCVLYSTKWHVPALICPCCMKPDAVSWFGQHNSTEWIKHLISLAMKGGMQVQVTQLKMVGKNVVLILRR